MSEGRQENDLGAPAAGSALQTWARLRNGECDCAQCQFYKQQIVQGERFNRWMAGGFVAAGFAMILFIVGIVWGFW